MTSVFRPPGIPLLVAAPDDAQAWPARDVSVSLNWGHCLYLVRSRCGARSTELAASSVEPVGMSEHWQLFARARNLFEIEIDQRQFGGIPQLQQHGSSGAYDH